MKKFLRFIFNFALILLIIGTATAAPKNKTAAAYANKKTAISSAVQKFIKKSSDTLQTTTYATNPELVKNLNNIIDKYDNNVNIGVVIQNAENGTTIYEQNAHRFFKPASTLKVFTAAAALQQLSQDYKFHTQIVSKNRDITNGAFTGDLYFYFDGDPTLAYEDLLTLIQQLKKSGINSITGNIYLDDAIFDSDNYGPGWMWDEKNFCYAAPTNAIILDKNCFPLKIGPAKENQQAEVTTDNTHSFIPITSSVIGSRSSEDECPLTLTVSNNNEYHLSGCTWPHRKPLVILSAVKNIRPYIVHIIGEMLLTNKINLSGKIDFAPSPITTDNNNKNYFIIASHESAPLSDIIKTMLKKSDNLIANTLFKKLGTSYLHKTGSWASGAKAISDILAQTTLINFKYLRIVDGAGLSQYNLVTPAQMANMLYAAYHNNVWQLPFLNALPIAGIDGHLQYRMMAKDLRGRVLAKTGTMKSISALAGYLTTYKNQKLIFVIFINDFVDKIHKYQNLEDEMCTYLVRNGV